MADHIEDDPRDQGFGFLVPMRFGFIFIEHQGIGKRHRIFGQIEAVGIKPVERIIPRGWPSQDTERIEAMNRPERFALAQCHTGILALGVDTHDRPIGGQQIGDDRADTLARARRSNRDQMGRPIITQQPAKGIAPDQQIALVLCQRVYSGAASEPRRAKRGIGTGEPDLEVDAPNPQGEATNQNQPERRLCLWQPPRDNQHPD